MTTVAFDPAFIARVSAARPAEMTALLIEDAIHALEETIDAIEKQEIERRFLASARAMKVVGFLHEILNFEEGGDIAVNLDRVYRMAMARIARINPFNEAESARAAIAVLLPQAEAWRQIDTEEVAQGQLDIQTLPGLAAQAPTHSAYAA